MCVFVGWWGGWAWELELPGLLLCLEGFRYMYAARVLAINAGLCVLRVNAGTLNARCFENEGRRVGNGYCMYDCVRMKLERMEKQAKQASETHWREYVSGSRAAQHGRSRRRARGEEKEEAGQPQGGTRGEASVGPYPPCAMWRTVWRVRSARASLCGAGTPTQQRRVFSGVTGKLSAGWIEALWAAASLRG